MKHSIVFKNADNHWDNGLPLGNGCFGVMLYFEKNRLYMPMNHYEVYYNIRENVLPADILAAQKTEENPGREHIERTAMADGNQPPEGEPFSCYRNPRSSVRDKKNYGISNLTGSYPQTGNLKFNFCSCLDKAQQKLALYVEDAKAELTLEKDEKKLALDTVVSRQDCIINHIKQNDSGLLTSLEIEFPPQRDAVYPEITYKQLDDNTFAYTVKRSLGSKVFEFSGIIRISGACGELLKKDFGAEIVLKNAEEEIYVITGIFTDWRYKKPLDEGISIVDGYEKNIGGLYDEHKKYWSGFFERSKISIPDKFLEHVYYVNQYALDCCSGKDGIMYHHACGLNGLWDVRHPSLWGSMWYWDVNIQAAFAGVFSSNRLELAKVFSDGLLSYTELAKKCARDIHNAGGIAGDYPYHFYYSCWPWCAQYLWFLYEYSLDKEYLEKEAFPAFVGLCEFFCDIFKYDEEKGYYSVYPDVSPEQGPLTHDSVITVSCVKYLFKFTMEAARILGKDPEIFEKCREIMDNMAPYPISEDGMYGVHLRDSHDAPDDMWIRHPSMLMPLFPIGEFDLNSDSKMVEILSNTVDFLDDRAEIGIFGGSWIAASAARLGRGQTALRLLYERGIDHMLRSNGLTAEETERFINYCLVPRQPIYYPCMMEFTGEMLAAVNEMLIQSHNGLIRVFPAIPDGNPEFDRAFRHGYSLNDCYDKFIEYEAWGTVRIDKLLCKGAFEVSALMTDRKLDFIEIFSKKGGKVSVTSPFMRENLKVYCKSSPIEFTQENGVISFDTAEGNSYVIAENPNICTEPKENDGYNEEVLSRETYTRRNIYLGENPETAYQKAVDGFVRDWYLGNVRMENHTMYKFDFTNISKKPYWECLPRQAFAAEERVVGGMGFFPLGSENLEFTAFQGYGFKDASCIEFKDISAPDVLRRDFVQGTQEAEFVIEAPRGQYELLVVSGDLNEDSVTVVEGVNGRKAGGETVKAGEYQCKLIPIVNEDDEPVRLKISTKEGYRWKINYIMLNGIKGY